VASSKSRLPAIAIALAIVAAGILTAAIVMRSRTTQEAAPSPAPTEAGAPPIFDDKPAARLVEPPDADVAAAPDANDCVPCQGCKPTTCRCADNSVVSSYHCRNNCCLSATETCDTVCASRSGGAPADP
jgi:hypothetical protein